MKATFSAASFVTVVFAVASFAAAQSYGTPSLAYASYGAGYYPSYGYGYHSSTFEEGVLRGYADLTVAQGQANYLNSLASINGQEAYSRYLQNRQRTTDTYFYMRQANRAAREAEAPQRLSREQYAALAKKSAPEGLSERQYDRTLGRLNWPAALAGDEFAGERDALDAAFRARSAGDVGAGSAFYGQVKQLTSSIDSKLKDNSRELTAAEYVAAKKFLMGVALESQRPVVASSLAMAN